MRSIQKLPRRSGRKPRTRPRVVFSHYYVEGRENREGGSAEEKNTMTKQTKLGGTFTLPGTATSLYRMGCGTMQLAGPEVSGPPWDVDAAIAVLRQAIAAGMNHIDTSDYYGP